MQISSNLRKYWYYYVLLLPAAIWFAIFCYAPMVGVIAAFKEYRMVDGLFGSEWVGMKQFNILWGAPHFLKVLRNTVYISALKLLCGFPAPIILSLMLNEVRSKRFMKTVQSVSYLPHFMSWVVLGGIFTKILAPSNGAVNVLIRSMGGQSIQFLTNAQYFVPVLIITDIWASVGWSSIIYLAVISGIDPQMYEAATVEGANRWQKIRFITLPSLSSIIGLQLILATSGILNAGFDQVFNLYNPTVYDVADILDTYVYRIGLGDFRYSLSTAVGLFKNVVGFALLITVNAIVKKLSDGGGIW